MGPDDLPPRDEAGRFTGGAPYDWSAEPEPMPSRRKPPTTAEKIADWLLLVQVFAVVAMVVLWFTDGPVQAFAAAVVALVAMVVRLRIEDRP